MFQSQQRRTRHRAIPRLASGAVLLALLLAAPRPGGAASTGSSSLFTPQGSGSGSANGDFLSTTAPGISAIYRYFVEVPPSLGRLRIQVFDADFGAGGAGAAGEGAAGRDRERIAFNSAVSYSLVDPSGATRPVRFSTGNTTTPAGADNAWLDLFNGNGRDVRDNFGTASYANNDGTDNWSADWIESDSTGAGPAAGVIQVTGGELRFQRNPTGTTSLEREADLLGTPGLDFQAAFLTFDYRTSGNLQSFDSILVEVSANGGTSWTTLETFSDDSSGSRTYDVTAFIANNTRVRWRLVSGFNASDRFFFVDNLRLQDGGALTAGHWELRVSQISSVTGGDDINAFGIRADDGDDTASGTELPVYYDSHTQYGVNAPAAGSSTRSYVEYPYVTSGCTASENDFDYDSNSGTVGAIVLNDRTAAFTQTIASAALSANNVWKRNTISAWTSDTSAAGYGIWKMALDITTYVVSGVINGNYTNVYFANSQAAANPPTVNPTSNTFRVYLPTDAGTAPVKPYVEQFLTYVSGPNPPAAGQTTRVRVTVRVANPAAQAITFSASNLVTSYVPGSGAVYAGSAVVGQGTVVSEPTIGGAGFVTWNPGTLAAGATAILSYLVDVTPTVAGQRVVVTGTPASNGTGAIWLDETGNATQTRATYSFGPLCELAATEGMLTHAVLASFDVYEQDGAVIAEWRTASEAGTAGFLLFRQEGGSWRPVGNGSGLLAGLLAAPQGGTYRVRDDAASPYERQRYRLVEVEAGGARRRLGTFERDVDWQRSRQEGFRPLQSDYERVETPVRPAANGRRPLAGEDSAGAGGIGSEDGSAAGEGLEAAAELALSSPAERSVHVAVRETGLYSLTAAAIAPILGFPDRAVEAMIQTGRLALTRNGRPVAWRADVQGGRAVALLFYGQGGEETDNLYTRDAVYRLSRGTGLAMSVVRVSPAGPSPAGSFAGSVHAEVNLLPATSLGLDPASDYWFWDFLQAGDPVYGTKSFNLDALGVAPAGAASLRVRLHGGTATGVAGEHHATVSLNGVPVGELRWQGLAPREAVFPIGAALLRERGNAVGVSGLLDAGVPYSIFYVDAFDLAYPRRYRAAAESLTFSGDGTLAVSGFAAPPAALLDLRDPYRPRWLTGATVKPDGAGGLALFFAAPDPFGTYLAAGPAAVRRPQALRTWSPEGLLTGSSGADYLVIAPPELAAPAARLAALRAAQGLASRVVDLRQVADEFGGGVLTPLVLRDFLQFAQRRWRPAPRYVVLAGAGSVDYRDLLGYGGNLLPPLMVTAPGGLFPSDSRLAAPPQGGLPGLAIGRIPVRTAAEMSAYVDKVAAYETAPAAGWAQGALLFADAPDRGTDFAAAADRAAGPLLSAYDVGRIDLATSPVASARAQMAQGLAGGASLVDYVGHGGLDRLSGAGLLTSADVPGLSASNRLAVVTAMTCAANRFAVPGVPALGERLTTRAGGGAIAVWAPSGLSIHSEASLLAERFYRQVAEASARGATGGPRLGDLVQKALAELRALGGSQAMIDIYNLLGDPGLRLKLPAPRPPTGGPQTGE